MKKVRGMAAIIAMMMAASVFAGCQSADNTSKAESNTGASSQAASTDESSNEESKTDNSEEESKKEESSVPKGEPVDASWFDDAVFVGDSVTLKLSYYADNGSLGDAIFLCEGSLGYTNALWDIDHEDNVHPSYKGVKYLVDDGIKEINPKKAFIMLGMNDIGLYGVDGGIESMITLTDRIHEKSPNTEIYIESVTPMLVESQLIDLNNENIRKFDEKLQEVCKEKGYKYLDVASAVDDGNGNLVPEYCGDPDAMGLHFSDEGCSKWVEYLKNNVNA